MGTYFVFIIHKVKPLVLISITFKQLVAVKLVEAFVVEAVHTMVARIQLRELNAIVIITCKFLRGFLRSWELRNIFKNFICA